MNPRDQIAHAMAQAGGQDPYAPEMRPLSWKELGMLTAPGTMAGGIIKGARVKAPLPAKIGSAGLGGLLGLLGAGTLSDAGEGMDKLGIPTPKTDWAQVPVRRAQARYPRDGY